MNASAFAAPNATAFQAAASLERYEEHLTRLLGNPLDDESLRRAGQDLDEIQRFSAGIPSLSVPAVALVMSHAELLLAMYRAVQARGAGQGELVDEAWDEHRGCIEQLRSRCLKPLLRSQR